MNLFHEQMWVTPLLSNFGYHSVAGSSTALSLATSLDNYKPACIGELTASQGLTNDEPSTWQKKQAIVFTTGSTVTALKKPHLIMSKRTTLGNPKVS